MPVGTEMTHGGRTARPRTAASAIFRLAAEVERWPALLPHYRYVRFIERRSDGGGIVDMSANRPFGMHAVADLVEVEDAGALRRAGRRPVSGSRTSRE